MTCRLYFLIVLMFPLCVLVFLSVHFQFWSVYYNNYWYSVLGRNGSVSGLSSSQMETFITMTMRRYYQRFNKLIIMLINSSHHFTNILYVRTYAGLSLSKLDCIYKYATLWNNIQMVFWVKECYTAIQKFSKSFSLIVNRYIKF